jgi:hypothetical protein
MKIPYTLLAAGGLGIALFAGIIGADVREAVLEGRCQAAGATPLWGTGTEPAFLPDGALRFTCRA